jgi:putative ATPase
MESIMSNPPLAEQLRPKILEEYIGQQHLTGQNAILRKAIESGNIPSMILWGPPGVGKTTLASIISNSLNRPFYTLSAISSGVKDVRDVIEKARSQEGSAILFIDEIHRFSKSQQDSLLGAVEKGIITLIGATTENPSFEVISPLLSRCQVYILKNLSRKELEDILSNAAKVLASQYNIIIEVQENEALIRISGGDARKLINAIELIVQSANLNEKVLTVTNAIALEVIQQNLALYDKGGEMHYDVISAFIKSLRGSDPNAAVYWLARMINGGEDLLFIARRMVILASEDIGNANPNALLMANTCFDAVNKIGYPESRIILSQTAIYLACSSKSNASYMAIESALAKAEMTGDLAVPLHIRNAPTQLMKEIGYGKDYKYAHSYNENFVDLEYMPDQMKGTKFYDPMDNPRENEFREKLRRFWKDKYGY